MIKDFFELLVKDYGLPEFLASYALITVYVLSLLYLIFKSIKLSIKLIRKRRIKKIVNQDLHPFFTHKEVYNYTRFYIPQYFQNISPTESEDFGKIHAAAARSKLMPEFLKKGLLSKSEIKYFMILSDTGMGKTAFLINLYIKYKSAKQKINNVKYNIKLIPLGASNALEKIKEFTV